MKKMILCLICGALAGSVLTQDLPVRNYWTEGTAYTVPRHRWEPSLFSMSRFGITDNLELEAHPLMMFVLPHLKIKAGWGEHNGFRFTTEHGILYPTLFLNLVSMRGIGGIISPEVPIPQMFAIENRLLVSCRPFRDAILTAHAGVTFSVHSGSSDDRSTIDLPVIYPRFAVFYDQPEIDAGIDYRGKFSPRFGWLLRAENFILFGTEQNYFLENKGVLAYTSARDKFRIEAGYKLCYGRYPGISQWHLLPDIGIIFGI